MRPHAFDSGGALALAGQQVRSATFILADISGYTAFLSEVGVAHRDELALGQTPAAYPLMTTLLDAIVGSLVPPFRLAKLEGDAVFAYAEDEQWTTYGDDVMACLRDCYARFREHLEQTEDALTCTCAACSTGARLDLKFVLHHGDYVAQTIAGSTELLGPDVTTAHRLLKNDVVARTGYRAYALVSTAAAEFLQLPRDSGVAIELEHEHVGLVGAMVWPLP